MSKSLFFNGQAPSSATATYYLIDSKGHSRFVLRILIILSHRESQTGESPRLLFERVGRQPRASYLCFASPRLLKPVKPWLPLSSLAQHNSPNETDETNSPARAASDPYCESQATMPSSSVGSRWSHPEKAGNPEPEAGNQLRRLAQDDVSL